MSFEEPSLFDPPPEPLVPPDPEPESGPPIRVRLSIQEKFEQFIEQNPHVYERFKQLAEQALNAGYSRYSADALLHILRWELTVMTHSNDAFRLNNNYTSRLSRRLAEEDARFAEFFETRRLREPEEASNFI